MAITLTRERIQETTTYYIYPRPITFDEWLEVCGPKDHFELVDGSLVEKPMVQLDHENRTSMQLRLITGPSVSEIIYIDQRRRQIRVLRRAEETYTEERINHGPLMLHSIDNLALEWDWLFFEPRPAVRELLNRLLSPEETSTDS